MIHWLTPLFSAVALEDIARFARLAEPMTKEAGQVIVDALQPVRHIYVVRSGTAHLVLDGAVVETLGSRQSFGETALFGEERSPVSLRAATQTALFRFPLSLVADLIAENPDVLSFLVLDLHTRLSALYGRLSAATMRAVEDNAASPEQRVSFRPPPVTSVPAAF